MDEKQVDITLTESELVTLYECVYIAMEVTENNRKEYRTAWEKAISEEDEVNQLHYTEKETECWDKLAAYVSVYQTMEDQTGLIY